MQIMPGTWNWIQETMAPGPLDPASVEDNIKAGSLYLGHLLRETGGDQAAAAAAYYQGLGALRSRGMFDDTRQYVANVQALQSRFGG
jgi:soluble lytic murein transglycosylase-like protein